MGYDKEFFEEDGVEKVKITSTGESRRLWEPKKHRRVKEKTFEVVDKQNIYRCIKNEEPIDLEDKYIEGFSLSEYREDKNLGEYEKVTLRDFNAEGAFFDGGADFGYAVFKERLSFTGATFGDGDVYFGFATFGEGEVSFEYATFGDGDVYFRGATFEEGKIDFTQVKIQDEWDLRVRKADTIDFRESKIYGNIDFSFYKDDEGNELTPEVEELCLTNTRLYGTIYMDYDAFNMPAAINDQTHTTHREKRDQFRLLKENFGNLGQYDDEGKAYRWFMYHKIRAEREFEESDSLWDKVRKSIRFAFKWLFYEKMGLYGTSPARVALSMIVVWFLFSFAYLPLVQNLNPAPWVNNSNGLAITMYHSIVTFLTIGYCDYSPEGPLRLLSGIEGFMVLFLMSYFTISFVREVLG